MSNRIEAMAKEFGCTADQIRAQYAKNADGFREMADKARKTGKKYRGYTLAELEKSVAEYDAYAKEGL